MRESGRDLLGAIRASAGEDRRRVLRAVEEVADRRGVAAYLVGGIVRDALLGHASPDLDVTVEGDAPTLAAAVAARLDGARLTVHAGFGTATVTTGAVHLDLITARREVYAYPGALPRVTAAHILEDLARRDFTINALALAIAGPRTGELLDPFQGRTDLEAGLLRVLHERSFQDDATRLLRAARYLSRFQFDLEQATRAAAARDRGYLTTISPARVRAEVVRCFAEAVPARAMAAIEGLGLTEALLDGLRYTRATVAGWRRLNRSEWDDGVLPWLLPVLRWPAPPLESYIGRFALTATEARAVRALPAVRDALTRLVRRPSRPSAIVAHLDRLPAVALLAWVRMSPSSERARIASRYLTEFQPVRPQLSSAALKAMGVPEGPRFGAIVRTLRAARLDDPKLTLDDERRLVQDMLEQQPGV